MIEHAKTSQARNSIRKRASCKATENYKILAYNLPEIKLFLYPILLENFVNILSSSTYKLTDRPTNELKQKYKLSDTGKCQH